MKVTIHQPEHIPWLGFFHKINMADVYVVLDNVQYRKRYFQNRNKIRTERGWQWITVPIAKSDTHTLLIKDVKIKNEDLLWKRKILGGIYHSYSKAKYFKNYWNDISAIYNKNRAMLADLNLELIHFVLDKLNIKKDIVLASSLKVSGKKGDLMLNICKELGGRIYVSGISGKEYLDFEKFEKNNIEVKIQEFHHPIYKQLYEPFVPCMSVIDLLFNHGPKSLEIINGVDVPVMEEVFT